MYYDKNGQIRGVRNHPLLTLMAMPGCAAQESVPNLANASPNPVTAPEPTDRTRAPEMSVPGISSQPFVATSVPAAAAPGINATPRDVSAIALLHPSIEGAMFDYEVPDVETLMKDGLHGFGASPIHVIIRGAPVAGSVRCAWHGVARTVAQRESTLRLVLDLEDTDTMPSAEQARTTLASYVALMAPEFRDAMQANMDHIIDGGLLDESRILACYVDYNASEYILGAGPATITVAYDNLSKSHVVVQRFRQFKWKGNLSV